MTNGGPRVIVGEPLSPSDVERLNAWSAYTDPLKSFSRLDDYAKWILGGNTLILTLAAGLAASGGLSNPTNTQLWIFGVTVLALGISWVGAATSLAPVWVAFNPESPDDVQAGFDEMLTRRRLWVRIATVCFGLALFLAAIVPLGKQVSDPPPVRSSYAGLTYSVDDASGLTAELKTSGRAPYSEIDLAVVADEVTDSVVLPRARALTDASGAGSLTVRLRDMRAVRSGLSIAGSWRDPGQADAVTQTIRVTPRAKAPKS